MSAMSRRLRIATYNVHGCVGTDRRCDPQRIARVVSELDADVVALQEFTYGNDIALDTRTAGDLGIFDGYHCALGPTLERRAQQFGNLVLTRHPIREIERLDLSVGRAEPRGALAVTIDAAGVELHVLATHLGLRLADRRHQVRRILEHVDALESKLLAVLGDFNDWLPGRSVVHALDQRLGHPPSPRSFPAFLPVLALDRIWVNPLQALVALHTHASAVARRASDHLPVVAELATA